MLFSRDSDNKLLPATALGSEHPKATSSIAITALMEEKASFTDSGSWRFVFAVVFCSFVFPLTF